MATFEVDGGVVVASPDDSDALTRCMTRVAADGAMRHTPPAMRSRGDAGKQQSTPTRATTRAAEAPPCIVDGGVVVADASSTFEAECATQIVADGAMSAVDARKDPRPTTPATAVFVKRAGEQDTRAPDSLVVDGGVVVEIDPTPLQRDFDAAVAP